MSFRVDISAGLCPVTEILFGRDPFGSTVLLGVYGRSLLVVRVGLVATLLVSLSTVLAHRPRADWFEDCFATILAD